VRIVIAIAVAVVLLAAFVFIQFNRRNRVDSTPPVPEHTRRPIEPPAPMTGLESALAHATDRTGRPMQARLDEESGHVDDLRVPDDTGPVLRRALDHVAHVDPSTPDDQPPANG
jgi:low affinity Fe/Cu permease